MAADNDRHDEARMVASRLEYLKRHARAEYAIKPGADIRDRPPIFYVPDRLVTTAEHQDLVRRILEEWFDSCGDPEPLVKYDDNLVVFEVGGDSLHTAEGVKRAAGKLGIKDMTVAPLHVLTPAPGPKIGPRDDPDPASAYVRQSAGPAVEPLAPVAVIDTGLWTDPPHPLSAGIAAGGEEKVDVNPDDGFVDFYGSGHGGFIGGVIENNAPGAKVIAHNAFHKGVLTEASVIDEIDAALNESDVVVLNVSLGSYEQADSSGGVELVALRQAMRRWRKANPNALIVAAAGNDSTTYPFFPAGFAGEEEFADMVVSVGALGGPADGVGIHAAAADFTNHGTWVTAWAPGEKIVSDYPKGLSFGYSDASGAVVTSSTFADGLAYWSGTSFAAPFVAAEIVREMREGESPRDTWKRIRGASPFVIFWPSW